MVNTTRRHSSWRRMRSDLTAQLSALALEHVARRTAPSGYWRVQGTTQDPSPAAGGIAPFPVGASVTTTPRQNAT